MGSWRITSVWGAAAAFGSVVDVGPGNASFTVADDDGGDGVWLDGRPVWTVVPTPAATGAGVTASV
jgi:hypothetical protein